MSDAKIQLSAHMRKHRSNRISFYLTCSAIILLCFSISGILSVSIEDSPAWIKLLSMAGLSYGLFLFLRTVKTAGG